MRLKGGNTQTDTRKIITEKINLYLEKKPGVHISITVVQYGSTTVVMAIYGLHWKWQRFTPCQSQRDLRELIEQFHTVDYVHHQPE